MGYQKTRWTLSILPVLALSGWSLTTTSAVGSELESRDVRFGLSINDSTFLPIYLAEEEGYFTDEGLNAEVTIFRGGSDLTRALVAGAVDVAAASPTSVLGAINAQQDVKIFFGGFNQTPFEWYAIPAITTTEAARGSRFGITRFGSSTDALTRYVLQAAGLNPDTDVQIIQGGGSSERLTAMGAGLIDVSILASPFNYAAADQGYNLIIRQSDAMPDFPVQSLYTSTAYMDSHPETIKAVLRAVIRGIDLAQADQARAVRTLIERTGLEPAYAERAYLDLRDGWRRDGSLPSEAGMAAFFEMAIAVGDAQSRWPVEVYFDDRFVSTMQDWIND
jgi:NitT/TauT family transport system substrate-binding protein